MTLKQTQLLLTYLGYETAPDGLWGPQTREALNDFRRDRSLSPGEEPGVEDCLSLRQAVAQDWTRPRKDGFWGQIRWFVPQEFACRCGQYHSPYCGGFPAQPDETLVRLADRVRTHFGRPAHVSSGLRCPRHNADVGGVSNSRHLSGKALDFFLEGVTGQALLAYVQSQPETRYAYCIDGRYVHMDVM